MPYSKIKLWVRTGGAEYRKGPHRDQGALAKRVDPVLVPQQT